MWDSPTLEVHVDGLIFEGWPEELANAYVIGEGGVEGWYDSTPTRQSGGERQGAHGSFDTPVFHQARSISISGIILAKNPVDKRGMMARLEGVLSEGQTGRFNVVDEVPTWAMVRQTGVTFQNETEVTVDFQISFIASDPRRYGEKRVYSVANDTPVTVKHYGNANSWPALEISGTMGSGYSILGPGGKHFDVATALSSPNRHLISLGDCRLYVNSVWAFASGNVTRSEIMPIPSGGSLTLTLDPVAGSGNMDVHVTDTYL